MSGKRFIRVILSILSGALFASCSLKSSSANQPANIDTAFNQISDHRVIKILNSENSGRDLNYPYAIFQDNTGTFWVGGGFGLYSYDEKQDRWSDIPVEPGFAAYSICQSADNKLWFASWSVFGPNIISYDKKHWHKAGRESQPFAIAPGAWAVRRLFSGRDSKVWFAVGWKLVSYDGRKWTLALDMARKGDPSDSGAIIAAVAQDREGNIWLAYSGKILRYNENFEETLKYRPSDSQVSINRIYEDSRGRIWCVGSMTSVFVFDKFKGEWITYKLNEFIDKEKQKEPTPSDLQISSILEDKSGRMMFGTIFGLATFSEEENKWEISNSRNSALPGDTITALMRDRQERIWIGTSRGIVVLEK